MGKIGYYLTIHNLEVGFLTWHQRYSLNISFNLGVISYSNYLAETSVSIVIEIKNTL